MVQSTVDMTSPSMGSMVVGECSMYVVMDGAAVALKNGEEVKVYTQGEFMGELAILKLIHGESDVRER
eukprot:SAG11_NODE_171_length_13596_cov_15.767356_8_plen_68_part_00